MTSSKRKDIDIAVISDVHLGTYGCKAKALVAYMKSISPRVLILNGDIFDIWQFSKSYWPSSHMEVVKQIAHFLVKGVEVYYITGNHDELFRKFSGFTLGNLQIVDKVVLNVDGKKAWFFHGDVFDVTMQHSKWLAKLGAKGYGVLILLNQLANLISEKILKRGRISLSKQIKDSVKSASIKEFESTAAGIAIDRGYDYVVCGHIHSPTIKNISSGKGQVTYLNSGDWVENMTSLEYGNGKWELCYHADPESEKNHSKSAPRFELLSLKQAPSTSLLS